MKILMIVVTILAAVLTFFFLLKEPRKILPPATEKTADSLAATAPAHASATDSLKRLAAGLNDRAKRLHADAQSANDRANVEKRRADSLARLAASDSAAWADAYAARTAEAAALQETVLKLRDENATLLEKAAADSARAEREKERRIALESLNRDVMKAIKKEQDCKVLFIPCPTRTEAAIGGYIAGTLITGAIALAAQL